MPVDLVDTKPLGSGIHAKHGVEIPTPLMMWLRILRGNLGFDIVVTSGKRGAEAQARAWWAKIALGYTLQDFLDLYRRDDLVREVFDKSDLTTEGMTKVFEAQMARGDFISSHMSGRAPDLRSRGYTEEEVAAIVREVERMGGRVVVETRPPHLHLEAYGLTDRKPSTTSRTWTVKNARKPRG